MRDSLGLSATEEMIMRCIWDSDDGLTVGEVQIQIKEKFDKDAERTTVSTFIRRMETKGFVLGFRRPAGHGYIYRAQIGQKEYRRKKQEEFKRVWYNGSGYDMLSSMYQDQSFTDEDLDRLLEDIQKKRKK